MLIIQFVFHALQAVNHVQPNLLYALNVQLEKDILLRVKPVPLAWKIVLLALLRMTVNNVKIFIL